MPEEGYKIQPRPSSRHARHGAIVGLATPENALGSDGPGLPVYPRARHHGPGDRPVLGGIGPPRRRAERRRRHRTLIVMGVRMR